MFDSVYTETSDNVSVGCELDRFCSMHFNRGSLIEINRKGPRLTITTSKYEVTIFCRSECQRLCPGSGGTR